MRIKVTITAAVLVLALLVAGAVVIADTGDTSRRPAWENEDGIGDMSKLPPTRPVLDSTGTFVGNVETRHYETDTYPLPVLGPDGQVIGHLGGNGFWRLGEPEPVVEIPYTVVEEFDESGKRTAHRLVYD